MMQWKKPELKVYSTEELAMNITANARSGWSPPPEPRRWVCWRCSGFTYSVDSPGSCGATWSNGFVCDGWFLE